MHTPSSRTTAQQGQWDAWPWGSDRQGLLPAPRQIQSSMVAGRTVHNSSEKGGRQPDGEDTRDGEDTFGFL